MSMNPQAKALWLEALRSGEYQQARTKLCTIDNDGNRSYCCLGVLTDVAIKGGFVRLDQIERSDDGGYVVYMNPGDDPDDSGFYAYTPEAVVEWAGLPAANPTVKHVVNDEYHDDAEYHDSLADLNDDRAYTFEQIAALVEEQL